MSTSDVIINIVPNKEAANSNAVVSCQKTGAYKTLENNTDNKPAAARKIELEYTDRFNKKRPSFGIVPTVAALPSTTTTTTTTTTPVPDCANSTSSVKMMGWYAGDRILSPIGYAPYGNETYVYGDEVVRYETGVWLYTNAGSEIVRAYSYEQWPWLAEWPAPYDSEKICDPANIVTTTTTTTTLPPNPFLYGVDVNGDIWEVDVANKSFAILAKAFDQNKQLYVNGVSYDSVRDHIYYFKGPQPLTQSGTTYNWYSLNYLSQSSNANNNGSVFTTRLMQSLPIGAAYYNNRIWFFKSQNSNILQVVSLDYSRSYVMASFAIDYLREYLIDNIDASQNEIGDIAIDCNTGIMYVLNTNGRFFSINLNSPTNTFNLIRPANSDVPRSPQLAFNTNYSTLYCHGSENGDWYTIDKTSGNVTSLNFKSILNDVVGNKGLVDIAGARSLSRIPSGGYAQPWEISIQTTDINQEFSLVVSGTAINIVIDWGDGTKCRYLSAGTRTYTYPNAGTYTIKISGNLGTNGNIKLGTTVQNRPRLKSVGIIPNIPGLVNFKQTFLGCTALNSVPENLFVNYPDLNMNVFDSTFSGCSGLTTIPENLFKNQTKLGKGDFYATFNNCAGLTTIPENLFRYNTSVGSASFNYTFAGCTSLNSIPADIFRYNTSVDNLSFLAVFDKVTIPTATYNDILVSLNTYLGSKTGMQFNGGNSKTSGSGTTARDSLVAKKWTILDGSDLVLHLDSQNSNSYTGSGIVWNDLSGFNNSAKLINGAYYDGQHMIFDGRDDYAEVLNNAYINDCLNSNFTFDIWVYLYSIQISQYGPKIVSKGGYFYPGLNGIAFNGTTGVNLQYKNSAGTLIGRGNISITPNTWVNLVYTRSNGVISVYKNGQFVNSATDLYDFRSNYNLRIGSNYQPDNQAKQKIAVLKQYRKSLTSSEILASYNALSGRFV